MDDDKTPQPTDADIQVQAPVLVQDAFDVTESGSLVDLPDQPSETEIFREIRSAPVRLPANDRQ